MRRPMKKTRADGNNDLVIPTIKHKSFGGRSVGYGGPQLWNTLPKELKTCTNINTFKKFRLKSAIFISWFYNPNFMKWLEIEKIHRQRKNHREYSYQDGRVRTFYRYKI